MQNVWEDLEVGTKECEKRKNNRKILANTLPKMQV